MISLSQAFANWQELAADLPKDDGPMLSESWNDYIDGLTKDGELCALQYHYAPAYDDAMPGNGRQFDPLSDDREFILDAMGVTMHASRMDGVREGWDATASHWHVTVRRNGKRFSVEYSMGSAHTGEPDLCDVLNAVLRDAECYANASSVDDFAEDYGYTKPSEAIRAWNACKGTVANLDRLFTSAELSDLRELFEDF